MVGVHVGGMIGPLIFGYVVDTWGNYNNAWLVTAGLVAIGVGLLAFKFRESPKK